MENSIKRRVGELIKKMGTNDPKEICRQLGIVTARCDLPKSTRGFCLTIKEGRAIMLNKDLNSVEEKSLIAHELGHLILHSNLNYMFLSTNTLMVTGKYEREANLFSAYLLLNDIDESENDTIESLSKALSLSPDAVAQILGK